MQGLKLYHKGSHVLSMLCLAVLEAVNIAMFSYAIQKVAHRTVKSMYKSVHNCVYADQA